MNDWLEIVWPFYWKYIIKQKDYNTSGSREILFMLSWFYIYTSEQHQISRTLDMEDVIRNIYAKRKNVYIIKTQVLANNHDCIIHKVAYKKWKRHECDIYKEYFLLSQNKLLVYLI